MVASLDEVEQLFDMHSRMLGATEERLEQELRKPEQLLSNLHMMMNKDDLGRKRDAERLEEGLAGFKKLDGSYDEDYRQKQQSPPPARPPRWTAVERPPQLGEERLWRRSAEERMAKKHPEWVVTEGTIRAKPNKEGEVQPEYE